MPAPPFRRKPPPLPMRLFGAVMMNCVFRPMMWGMRKMGRTEKMFGAMHARQRKRLETDNPFRSYAPGPQDVFVMTFAKSGTNWMMQIVYQLIHHGKGEFDHIHDVVPWPDAALISPTMKGYAVPLEQANDWETAPERRRVIKTHLDWKYLPYSEQARYIAVIRDPKDTFVSAYFFLRDSGMGSAIPPVDAMHRMFVADKFLLGESWPANAAAFWAERYRPNVLVMSFKSMKRDLEGTVRRVAEFLDIHVSEEVIQEVCRKASFSYMKSIDEKFAPGRMSISGKGATMMRQGKQGSSGELLTPAQQTEIDEHCIAELKRLGSDLPYEEFADSAPPGAAAETHAPAAAGR